MSWLARKLDLSYDLFESVMLARERQTKWLANLILHCRDKTQLPIVILGKAYKPECALTDGSPAMLLAKLLAEAGMEFDHFDPFTDEPDPLARDIAHQPSLFFIATKHRIFREINFPAGSVVIDPFRYISPQGGIEVIPIGKGA